MGQPIKVRALKWIVGHDTGLSSEAIWAHMMDAGEPAYGWSYPSDPDDLGRCLRLLELIPEWKPRLPEMATRSPIWKSLIAQWDQLKESMDQEVGIDWSNGREAIKTYNLMKSIICNNEDVAAQGAFGDCGSGQTQMIIKVMMEDRPDGGLRVWSDQVRGLILSGPNKAKVIADIEPAVRTLMSLAPEMNVRIDVTIIRTR